MQNRGAEKGRVARLAGGEVSPWWAGVSSIRSAKSACRSLSRRRENLNAVGVPNDRESPQKSFPKSYNPFNFSGLRRFLKAQRFPKPRPLPLAVLQGLQTDLSPPRQAGWTAKSLPSRRTLRGLFLVELFLQCFDRSLENGVGVGGRRIFPFGRFGA